MELEQAKNYVEDQEEGARWLASLGVVDSDGGHSNLVLIFNQIVSLDVFASICSQLAKYLPELSDPDMALNSLERFFTAVRNPLSLGTLFERDDEALPTLLQIFSTSQYLSDQLVRDSESYELLRLTEGKPVAREVLVEELASEVGSLADEAAAMKALRRFKHRETLRIAYGDIVRGQPLETVSAQISYVAEAIVEAALRFVRRRLEEKRGVPQSADGEPARFVVLAMGKLGGMELNYSSDIDLVMLYDVDGQTDGRRALSNQEFFERVARDTFRMIHETTDLGAAYRVDLRLRPQGSQGPIVGSLESFFRYYDAYGRTWERQAYVKARPIAGNVDLGNEFLKTLEPWIYRRWLSRADITGIKSLKRRIEQKTDQRDGDQRNIKTGHGGIRDIEFAIQFLQLLNGATLPGVRTGNTLRAILQLEQAGCLTFQEREILEQNYRFLRKVEHRLQILFDLQTHTLPSNSAEMRKLAIRMGFSDTQERTALEAFDADLRQKQSLNRKILDHLLHDAFGDDPAAEPEVDLVNDPNPPRDRIHEVLSRHGFSDLDGAYNNLMALATEKIRFLSTRRCRHFLASIAPSLLAAIAETPDPDATLVSLSQVSDSLGGKGVLWELFSFNPPSMKLYVRLCAAAPYLSGILISNPGMLDELLDSLLLAKLPTLTTLEETLTELCRGAEDCDPILHSFKDAHHLQVGVRDIVGKDDIRDTHATLSDIAEACVKQLARKEHERLVEKFGTPTIGDGPRKGQPCELLILALGKLGGREPNYHSDLDIVFLYEAEGNTVRRREGRNTTSNQHFFSELGQRIIKIANHLGPYGRLYEVDPRLRPTGRSGTLAVSIDEFRRYFAEGAGQLWERQALCKGRVIYGSPGVTGEVVSAVHDAAFGLGWAADYAEAIRQMRWRLEESASSRNLKRGPGGTVDIEFAVQMLQLKHGGDDPSVRVPGTFEALDALHKAGALTEDDYQHFSRAYRFLRNVEARIRLMASAGRHEMPTDEMELKKLAFLLDYGIASQLQEDTERITEENRRRFNKIFDREVSGSKAAV